MAPSLALSFLAGSLSTLSPCVLPLLPVLLGGAFQQHRLAPAALAGGLAISFASIGLSVATLGLASGIDGNAVRIGAAGLMAAFGVVMLSGRLQAAFTGAASRLSNGAGGILGRLSGEGLAGQFLLGLLLGAVWSPCAGPTLGAAVGMAAESGNTFQAAGIMTVFSLGTATPVLALAYGSRQAMATRKERMALLAKLGKPVMGAALLATGLLVVSGLDKTVEAKLTSLMPYWLVDLTTRF